VEGEGVTDWDSLDDPANIIPGAPGALRLDDTEKLVRESFKTSNRRLAALRQRKIFCQDDIPEWLRERFVRAYKL
jgi:hypothetical protein